MRKRTKVLKEIAQAVDHGDFSKKAEKLGEAASEAFGQHHRNQMTSLENIANSTLKVTDVLDYVKKQVAKADPGKTWRKDHGGSFFGECLKTYIEKDLGEQRDRICTQLEVKEDPSERQRIHLELTREFVRRIVVHYEYRVTIEGRTS